MSRSQARIVAAIASVTLAGAALGAGAGALANEPSPSASAPTVSAAPGSPMVGLAVEGAWARVSPMVERAGAAYMVIRSGQATDDALVAATSPAAAVVEMHLTEADAQGMMTMHPVPEIPVPAGGSVELAPGGYHLMLIDLVAPLVDGSDVELVLTFRSGAMLTVHARVGAGAPMGSPGMPMPSHAGASAAPMGSSVP